AGAGRGSRLGGTTTANGRLRTTRVRKADLERCGAPDDAGNWRDFGLMSRPLNFLHLTTFYPPYSFGGDAIQLYRLSQALGDSGHHVDVVHCEDSYYLLHPGKPPVTYADHPNVTRHGLRSGFKSLSPLLTQQTGRPFLKRKVIDALLESRRY